MGIRNGKKKRMPTIFKIGILRKTIAEKH